MGLVGLSATALIFAVIIVYLNGVNKEIATLALIAASGILLIMAADGLSELLGIYEELADLSGISENLIKTVVKITLLCYVSEFAIGLIEDFGLRSLADKLGIASKIVIIIAAAPILQALISAVSDLVF